VRVLDTGILGRWLSRHMEEPQKPHQELFNAKRLFEDMGFLYLGPIDGHDIPALTRMFRRAKELKVP
jgi:1-deoxy-D-xylulose-5-phosphate synthase